MNVDSKSSVNFLLVIDTIKAENPDVEVTERRDPMINLGACEVYHNSKVKKNLFIFLWKISKYKVQAILL